MNSQEQAPLATARDYEAPSAFKPESMLRETRRQKSLPDEPVPKICVLDPDGDIVREMRQNGRAQRCLGWACYHSELYVVAHGGVTFGVVGCAVGAPYAVLVAEQLFVSGCKLLISVTSAGQLNLDREPPFFVLIERALRDEGTSYHYQPPAKFSELSRTLADQLAGSFGGLIEAVIPGSTWTTDAPYRETAQLIEDRRALGLHAVEMEAAALYAFAAAKEVAVVCFAHVTNQMGQVEKDFEKGHANGTTAALGIIAATARQLSATLELDA
jgi:uridine phosphorylase